MRSAVVAAWLLAGCFGTGSLDLDLVLPTEPDLKPTGMTTITVLATSPELDPIANRTVLTGSSFSAGELPVAENVQINVLLHDVSNRLVGLGEAPELVDIVGDEKKTLTIPVRRPFIYASSGSALYTFDPTLDPRNIKFQGRIAGLTSPAAGVSVGGDRFVVAGGTSLQIIETATHKVTGNAIALPGMVNDIAPVPTMKKVAVAHANGIAIVNIDTGEVVNAAVGAVDRVTVGPAVDGRMFAYGLIGRVSPPENPLIPCTGTSSIVAVSVDTPAVTSAKPLPSGISAIAAAPAQAAVFATLPCAGQVARIDGDPTSEVGQLTLTMMSELKNAAALAVLGDRVYSTGTTPSTPVCNGACTATTSTACPETTTNRVGFITAGARLVVQSQPIIGGNPITLELPERRETMVDLRDMARQHAQVLHPFGTVPLDLVALPGGQYVSVVTRSNFYIESLVDSGFGTVILPCLKTQSADWILVDLAASSVVQRVRSHCMITNMRSGAVFDMWDCDEPPESERSTQGDYVPLSVGALFGAR
ncbi:MAG TPA: hypothetical protein VIV11_07385 [Kofleriaceae bacterium]